MIVTDKLIYLHIPKTAGMFVGRWLRELFPEASDHSPGGIRQHASLAEVPAELLDGRTVFATVRRPWSWYVSLYTFALSLPARRRILDGFWDDPADPTFAGTARRMVDPVAHGIEPDAWDPPTFGTPEMIPTMDREGWGLATWWARSTTEGEVPCLLVDCDRLAADLPAVLVRAGVSSYRSRSLLSELPRENVSQHGPWLSYYAKDIELFTLVETRDAWLTRGSNLGP